MLTPERIKELSDRHLRVVGAGYVRPQDAEEFARAIESEVRRLHAENTDRAARTQADSVCYDYAKQIAESMWATHYKADAPHWESCDSLMGVLSQISNMMCGLSSAPADSVTAPADGANWQDISTAPKDGTRFVAVGNDYGLYSEPQHTCIAQWFRGCWMEVSEWNDASELKYLTHWMPLPPLPGSAASAPADSVTAPAGPSFHGDAPIDWWVP